MAECLADLGDPLWWANHVIAQPGDATDRARRLLGYCITLDLDMAKAPNAVECLTAVHREISEVFDRFRRAKIDGGCVALRRLLNRIEGAGVVALMACERDPDAAAGARARLWHEAMAARRQGIPPNPALFIVEQDDIERADAICELIGDEDTLLGRNEVLIRTPKG